MRLSELEKFLKRQEEGGLKHFKIEELDEEYFLPSGKGALVPYLDGLQKDLNDRA